MRKILFRGKRRLGNEWIEGSLHTEKFTDDEEYLCCEINQCDVYPETVGQYTGLTDKNGKKIFEGDIVTNPKGDIGRVTWYEEHCAFMIYSITENKVYWLFDNDFSLIEIIGNIHDNPKLLQGGER